MRVVAVCIPWRLAGVRSGTTDTAPWQDHLRYLELIAALLADRERRLPHVVVGDFNQRVPPSRRGNRAAAEALTAALDGFSVATAGTPPGCRRPGIDHIAHDHHLLAADVWGWPNDHGGTRMSDHDGAGVDLTPGTPPAGSSISTRHPE